MTLLVFFGVLFASAVVINALLGPSVSKKELARTMEIIATARREEGASMLAPTADAKSGFDQVEELVQRFGFSGKLQRLIEHSGSQTSVGAVVTVSVCAAIAAFVVVQFTVGLLPLAIAAAALGALGRTILLRFQRARRVKKFDAELVKAIELLTRALRAGHSVGSAIDIVAEQSSEPLGSEFAAVSRQQRFGVVFRDSMLQLADRIPSKDLQFLVTAILVQKETGGDLTDILDRTSRTIRERMRIHGEIRTKTAQGRYTGMILSLLPVIMLVFINMITPQYSRVLFHDPTGHLLLYIGGTMIGIGGLIIRKIVDIKV